MKYRERIWVVLVISLMMLCLSVPVQAQSNNDGLLYDYDVYGDITIIVNGLNETWVDSPDQPIWHIGSFGFNWDFPVGSFVGDRVQSAELFMADDGNDTLEIHWLSDSVDVVWISLYNYSLSDWTIVWSTSNAQTQWNRQNHTVMSDNRNGTTVPVRFEFVKDLHGGGGNWISQLYIDYARLVNSTVETYEPMDTENTLNETAPFDSNLFVGVIDYFVVIGRRLFDGLLSLFALN